jgi:pyruvate,water dikinase
MSEMSKEEYALGSKVIERFFGDEYFPVKWGESWDEILNTPWVSILKEHEKDLHWFRSDLHNPHPWMPYMDYFSWWDNKVIKACEYMFRRFWAPTGIFWPAKVANWYVYTTIIPRDPKETSIAAKYFSKVLPIYAKVFLEWWEKRYIPEIERNLEFIFNYPYDKASLDELMVLLEEMIDIYERHYKIHWILNFAQLAAFVAFKEAVRVAIGDEKYSSSYVQDLIARILVSTKDKNWDSLYELYRIKEYAKKNPEAKALLESSLSDIEVWETIKKNPKYKELYEIIEKYLKTYGRKSMYVYEFDIPTWEEDPSQVIAQLRTYLAMDYDFYADHKRVIEDQNKAIEELMKLIPEEKKENVRKYMELAITMAPLTPDHHFYIDQQTNAAAKYVLKAIGKKLKEMGLLEDELDVLYLTYDELRSLYADPSLINAKELVQKRKKEREAAKELVPPPYLGTITEWSIKEEPYKVSLWGWSLEKLKTEWESYLAGKARKAKMIKGLAVGVPKIIEGVVKVVEGPKDFAKVQKGDIVACDITSPAWIAIFPKITGLICDSGGPTSHPAIVSREFGIPCIVGTRVATKVLRDGMKVRLDGINGVAIILE